MREAALKGAEEVSLDDSIDVDFACCSVSSLFS